MAELDKDLEHDSSVWKEISGYYYRYRISDWGIVQRYYPNRHEWVTKKAALRGHVIGSRRLAVKLVVEPMKYKEVYVVDLMAEAFMGGRAAHPNMVITHKNGCKTDCSYKNLMWITKQDLGRMCGKKNGHSVEKIDKEGNVVHLYRSVTECCEKEYMSRRTLWRILSGVTKNPYALTGYTYRYEKVDQEGT